MLANRQAVLWFFRQPYRSLIRFCGSTSSQSEKAGGSGSSAKTFSRQYPQLSKKDVRPKIDYLTSIRYMRTYADCYGNEPVYFHFRRNHKGPQPKQLTRPRCIINGHFFTLDACPVCRDDYLVLDYRNLDLLHQFINADSGDAYPTSKTGLCQQQHRQLLISLYKARDYGYINSVVPFREYDYSLYYSQWDDTIPAIQWENDEPEFIRAFREHVKPSREAKQGSERGQEKLPLPVEL